MQSEGITMALKCEGTGMVGECKNLQVAMSGNGIKASSCVAQEFGFYSGNNVNLPKLL